MKKCRRCGEPKPLSDFHNDSSRKDGGRSACKICDHKSHARWVGKNRRRVRAYRRKVYTDSPGRHAANLRRSRRAKRGFWLVRTAVARAKKKGVPYNLSAHASDIQRRIDAGFCEITGVEFSLDSPRAWNAPSLHRVIPKNGYTHENVQVVCHAINCMIGTWGEVIAKGVMRKWLKKAPPLEVDFA